MASASSSTSVRERFVARIPSRSGSISSRLHSSPYSAQTNASYTDFSPTTNATAFSPEMPHFRKGDELFRLIHSASPLHHTTTTPQTPVLSGVSPHVLPVAQQDCVVTVLLSLRLAEEPHFWIGRRSQCSFLRDQPRFATASSLSRHPQVLSPRWLQRYPPPGSTWIPSFARVKTRARAGFGDPQDTKTVLARPVQIQRYSSSKTLEVPSHGGEETPCDATAPQTCQAGDLGGKHGNITSGSFHAAYTDLYVSLVPGLGSFFGNRSAVVHSAKKMCKKYSRPLLFSANPLFLSFFSP
ncbi:hypothetical protein W97_05696 [Coniosporium apollinis CBS 100218]|uniref:Uncharacterized protein n=1 Tax=Coniosporium apollinis (strain CBS 100218) TaxID=1168221 RepID=R7YWT1_CONA1|nr:uncharacterized protein W97_05696 [Coniosporium apollinis CBS 100218]EON66303.1 hypothetical protein W97_05696 [Coniosporium apollinis CBS 100218]